MPHVRVMQQRRCVTVDATLLNTKPHRGGAKQFLRPQMRVPGQNRGPLHPEEQTTIRTYLVPQAQKGRKKETGNELLTL